MTLKELDRIELPASADMHVHLRQGAMMELVVPQIKKGGVDTVFVMVSSGPPSTLQPCNHALPDARVSTSTLS